MQPLSLDSLRYHIPAPAVTPVWHGLQSANAVLIAGRNNVSRMGDFMPLGHGSKHRIRVNAGLSPQLFLLVLLHELAHLHVYLECGDASLRRPHGKQWKICFGALIRRFLEMGCFHPQLHGVLLAYSKNVKASGLGSLALAKAMRDIEESREGALGWVFLDELPHNTLFFLRNGRAFRKLEKRRTRYLCLCARSGKKYLINHQARVSPRVAIHPELISVNC